MTEQRQRGAATVVVAVVLLIGVTLLAILTAKTVLLETKNNADNYRMQQAVSAANYAMDYAVNYFDSGGFDQNDDGVVDTLVVPNLTSNDNVQITTATASFDNTAGTRCVTAAATPSLDTGMITAIGFSDDGQATRTITQCVGPFTLLSDDGPDMPLISRSQVGLTGTANIVNRYTNINIWSGEEVVIGSSSSMETYIRDPSSGNLTEAQLIDTNPANNTTLVSNKNLGNGLDIIDKDPSVNTLTPDLFFTNFFSTGSRDAFENLAKGAGQRYTNIDDAFGQSGVIWVEGDQSLNSNQNIGSPTAPAIVVVNGDLRATGGPTIYGLVYVVGGMEVAGTVNIVGTSIVEGDGTSGNAVFGNGTLNLIYWQDFLSGINGALPGLTAVIADSWRDW